MCIRGQGAEGSAAPCNYLDRTLLHRKLGQLELGSGKQHVETDSWAKGVGISMESQCHNQNISPKDDLEAECQLGWRELQPQNPRDHPRPRAVVDLEGSSIWDILSPS